MSPRAACRLEALGFREVYDYGPGKTDWLGHGLPVEGRDADLPRAGDAVREDVVTAKLGDRVGDLRELVERSPYGFALVVSDGGTLLGRLRKAALEGEPHATAEEVMEPGPTTTRPDTPLSALASKMRKANLRTYLVSDPHGKLLGVLRRDEVEARLS
jgi:CBS domain-containing protein